MKELYRCIQAEALKAKNSYAFWLAWVGTSFVALALFIIVLLDNNQITHVAEANPWRSYVQFYYSGTNFMLLPLFIIIIASLVTFIEHRNGMWKHLYVLNVSRWHLYVSKFIVIVLLFAAAHTYFVLLMLISGVATGIIRPSSGLLSHFPDFVQIGTRAFKTVFSVLGLLAVQYWISIRFRSFIVPLGVGVIGFVMATLMVEQSHWVLYMPYAHPLLYAQGADGPIKLSHWGPISEVELYSLLYCVVFVPLGYWLTRRMTVEGQA